MAKADLTFSGIDSFCRSINAARREDGQWFYRSWGYNGYGNAWSKWTPLQESLDKYIRSDGDLDWGFSRLSATGLGTGIRLPN